MGDIESNTVSSADGAVIEYLSLGTGPPIVLVPGSLSTAHDLLPLAKELATTGPFAVHIINGRGRGSSGPQYDDYSLSKECEDLQAVYKAMKSTFVFGHSYGGIVCLETAMRFPEEIEKIVVYEPGMSIDGSINLKWKEQSEKEIEEGKLNEAFIMFIQGSNPNFTGRLPRWLLKFILWLVMKSDELQQKYRLMPTTIKEHVELAKRDNTYKEYAEIMTKVCALHGNDDQAEKVARTLEKTVRDSVTVKFDKMDHFGPERSPKEVAEVIVGFYHRGEEIIRE